MKKLKLNFALICVFFSCFFLSAENTLSSKTVLSSEQQVLLPDNPATYVVYEDKTWKETAFIGFFRYDAENWLLFANCPTQNINVRVYLRTAKPSYDGEIPESAGIQVDQGKDDVFTVNYLLEVFDNLRKVKNDLKNGSSISQTIEKDIDLFSGNVVIETSFLVPLFTVKNIDSISHQKILTLVASGIATEEADVERISGFSSVPKCLVSPVKLPAVKSKPLVVKEAGVQIQLDSRWVKTTDEIPGVSMYLFGEGEALMTFKLLDLKKIASSYPLENYLRLSVEAKDKNYIKPSSVNVKMKGNTVLLSFEMQDSENKSWFKVIKRLFINKQNIVSEITQTVKLEVYKSDSKYFNKLLDEE